MYPIVVSTIEGITLPPPKRPPKTLSLEEKVALIKESDGCTQRLLAEKYNIGKTQVCSILKKKRRYLDAFENNVPSNRKRLGNVTYDEVDRIMWEWFQCKRAKFYLVSGPLLQAQAKKFASQLGHDEFKASNGWLSSFKQRHNIGSLLEPGDKTAVYMETVHGWNTQLCNVTVGYHPRDIYNLDETSILFRVLPCRSFLPSENDCASGGRADDRITVCLVVNTVGQFDKPIVIGQDAMFWCFKNLAMDTLPVRWHSNRKSWMTSRVFNTWLNDFNSRMKSQNRNVLLFLDNAFSHSHQSNGLSNVRLVFSPSDATSLLHPLGQGIIESIKVHYRYRFLSHILTQLDEINCKGILELSKSVNVLNAFEWVAAAVNSVRAETVKQSFIKAGFQSAFLHHDDDEGGDESLTLTNLTLLLREAADQLPEPITDPFEYASIDSSIPCSEELADDWEENLVSEWMASTSQVHQEPAETAVTIKKEIEDGDESDDKSAVSSTTTSTSPTTAITSVKHALKNTRAQRQFAIEMGFDNVYRLAVEMEAEYTALLHEGDEKPTLE